MKTSFVYSILAALTAVVTSVVHPHCAPPSPLRSPSPSSSAPQSPSPSNSTDCSTVIYDMADCLTFLSKGSNDTKPTASCCSGFKSVLKVDPHCICEALKSSAQLGLDLNMTRAIALPSACGVSAPPIGSCGIPLPPGAAPANPPNSSVPVRAPAPSNHESPTPSTARPPAEEPSTTSDSSMAGACSVPVSFTVFIFMLVASFSYKFV